MDPFAGISWLSKALRPSGGGAPELPKPASEEEPSFDHVLARTTSTPPDARHGALPPGNKPAALPLATTEISNTVRRGLVQSMTANAPAPAPRLAQRANQSSKSSRPPNDRQPLSESKAQSNDQKTVSGVPARNAAAGDSDEKANDANNPGSRQDAGQPDSDGKSTADSARDSAANNSTDESDKANSQSESAQAALALTATAGATMPVIARQAASPVGVRAAQGVATASKPDDRQAGSAESGARQAGARGEKNPSAQETSADANARSQTDVSQDSPTAGSSSQKSAADQSEGGAVGPAGGAKQPATDAAQTVASDSRAGPAGSPANPDPPDGTSAAQYGLAMKKAEKMAKDAGSAEQELPGVTVLAAQTQSACSKDLATSAATPGIHDAPAVGAVSAPRGASAEAAPSPASNDSTQSDARLRTAERTHDLVALHAMRLRDSGVDSMRVVLKPAAGIQLSLELTSRDGSIEARATLNRGDYQYFSRHWPELQQKLEPRGVQLAPLGRGENVAGDTSGFKQPRQQAREEDPAAAGAFAEFAVASAMTESPATRAVRTAAHHGWETWA